MEGHRSGGMNFGFIGRCSGRHDETGGGRLRWARRGVGACGGGRGFRVLAACRVIGGGGGEIVRAFAPLECGDPYPINLLGFVRCKEQSDAGSDCLVPEESLEGVFRLDEPRRATDFSGVASEYVVSVQVDCRVPEPRAVEILNVTDSLSE